MSSASHVDSASVSVEDHEFDAHSLMREAWTRLNSHALRAYAWRFVVSQTELDRVKHQEKEPSRTHAERAELEAHGRWLEEELNILFHDRDIEEGWREVPAEEVELLLERQGEALAELGKRAVEARRAAEAMHPGGAVHDKATQVAHIWESAWGSASKAESEGRALLVEYAERNDAKELALIRSHGVGPGGAVADPVQSGPAAEARRVLVARALYRRPPRAHSAGELALEKGRGEGEGELRRGLIYFGRAY